MHLNDLGPIEIASAWLGVARKILVHSDLPKILVDGDALDENEFLGNENLLGVVLSSILK